MATNEEEINVINHLLQVEKESALLIDEALQEAEKRLSKARGKFNQEYKEKYDKGVEVLEEKQKKAVEQATLNHDKIIQDFKDGLKNKKQDPAKFNKLLESLLFDESK